MGRRKIEKHIAQTQTNDLYSLVEKYPKEEGYLFEIMAEYNYDGDAEAYIRVYKIEDEATPAYINRMSRECRSIILRKTQAIEKEIVQRLKAGEDAESLIEQLKELESWPIPKSIKELELLLKKLEKI